jgi:hypothetical protein
MALPVNRNTSYAAGSQVKSLDLNALQDCLVDLNKLFTGVAQALWTPTSLQFGALFYTVEIPIIIPGARGVDGSASHNVLNSASGCRIGFTLNASTNPLTYPIDGLRVGDVITAWSVAIDKLSNGVGAYEGWIKSLDQTTYAEASESAGTGIQNGGGAISGWAIGESGLAIAVVAGKQYYIDVDPNASCATDSVYAATVSVKRPQP